MSSSGLVRNLWRRKEADEYISDEYQNRHKCREKKSKKNSGLEPAVAAPSQTKRTLWITSTLVTLFFFDVERRERSSPETEADAFIPPPFCDMFTAVFTSSREFQRRVEKQQRWCKVCLWRVILETQKLTARLRFPSKRDASDYNFSDTPPEPSSGRLKSSCCQIIMLLKELWIQDSFSSWSSDKLHL